ISSAQWIAQTFTPSVSGPLTEADLDLFCSSCTGTTPSLTVAIEATSSGVPTGPELATATIAGFASGSPSYHSATFGSPLTVNANTVYALVVRPTAGDPSVGSYAILRSTADAYAGGSRLFTANNGSTWNNTATDVGFKVSITGGFPSSGNF